MIELAQAETAVQILPGEGGAAVRMLVDDRDVLCRTTATDAPERAVTPAVTEDAWVRAWRGGWQLCFPSAGMPQAGAVPPQSFHGTASQAPWSVLAGDERSVELVWSDNGLHVSRTWTVAAGSLSVATLVRNDGAARRLAIAEHLILGGEVLRHPTALSVPGGSTLSPLAYDGTPSGDPEPWPGEDAAAWATVTATTPARVAVISPPERRIHLEGSHVKATVTWSGDALPHALLWEELGASTEPPWNGDVFALGIEPTSTPHGLGTGFDDQVIELAPAGRLEWNCALRVEWVDR